jgi:hypothetical protein
MEKCQSVGIYGLALFYGWTLVFDSQVLVRFLELSIVHNVLDANLAAQNLLMIPAIYFCSF